MSWKNLLRNLFRKAAVDRELDEELRFHLEKQIEENLLRGMTKEEARRQAHIELGGAEQVKEQVRETRSGFFLEMLWQDIRYGARTLRQNPGFTFVAVLTLAFGIGATTAIFSVVQGVLLRPLPYEASARLVSIGSLWTGFVHSSVSEPEFVDYRERSRTLEHPVLYRWQSFNASSEGDPQHVEGAVATASLFDALGRQAALGRVWAPDENLPGNHRVVVLSHGLWQSRFGGDSKAVGQTIRLNSEPHTIIGVMPPDFYFPNPLAELWAPLPLDPQKLGDRGAHNRSVIARRKPGVTLEQAQAEMDTIARQLAAEHPASYPAGSGWGISVRGLQDHIVREVRPALLALLSAVGLVLLIACANVASLLLARTTARGKELAVRAALGASRARLARQLLTESLLLALLGGFAGVLVAAWAVDLLPLLGPGDIPRLSEVRVNPVVLSFALGVSVLTGILFGLGPVRLFGGADPQRYLRNAGRATPDLRSQRVRKVLVVAEMGLTLGLLVGAALLVRSFERLAGVDPGLRADGVVTASITPSPGRYREWKQIHQFYQPLLRTLKEHPGIIAAGAISELPLGGNTNDLTFAVEGYTPAAPGVDPNEQTRFVAGDYFRALRIPLLGGRYLDDTDTRDRPPVVAVSESLARKYWGHTDVVGKRIKLWSLKHEGPWWQVVGVVGDVRHLGLQGERTPILYMPNGQYVARTMTLVVHSATPASVPAWIREAVRSVDSEQAIYSERPMEAYVADSLAHTRFQRLLLSLFAFIALAVAAVGLYGVIAFEVAQRTQEIGVRMALGARQADIFAMLLRRGLLLILLGLGAGGLGTLALGTVLRSLLFGVTPTDPAALLGGAAVLSTVGLLACLVPARRATRVDPIVALRYE